MEVHGHQQQKQEQEQIIIHIIVLQQQRQKHQHHIHTDQLQHHQLVQGLIVQHMLDGQQVLRA